MWTFFPNATLTALPPFPPETVVYFALVWRLSNEYVVKRKVCCCFDFVAPGDMAAIQRRRTPYWPYFAQQANERWECASRLRSSTWSKSKLIIQYCLLIGANTKCCFEISSVKGKYLYKKSWPCVKKKGRDNRHITFSAMCRQSFTSLWRNFISVTF